MSNFVIICDNQFDVQFFTTKIIGLVKAQSYQHTTWTEEWRNYKSRRWKNPHPFNRYTFLEICYTTL